MEFLCDKILNIVHEIETLTSEDNTFQDIKKNFPNEIEKLEETLTNCISENDLEVLKTEFSDIWICLNKKLAYPNEYFNSIDDYQKSISDLKKEDFFSKLKIDYPNDNGIEATKEIFKFFNRKSGEEFTELYLKNDIIFLSFVIEKFGKISINEFDINLLFCVSLLGYTWQCGLKYTGNKLQTLQDENLTFTLNINVRVGISSVRGDRYVISDEKKDLVY